MFLLWSFYRIVLQGEKMFVFNRFYLLGSILFAFIVPNISVISTRISEIPLANISLEPKYTVILQEETQWNFTLVFWLIYSIITAFFLLRYAKGISLFYEKIRRNEIVKQGASNLVLTSDKWTPHSFFNYIFVDKEKYNNHGIDPSILDHEMAHTSQLHSVDIVIVELLKVFFWFNPVLTLYSRSIRANHEFLADEFALSKLRNIPYYQQLLLSSWTNKEINSNFSSGLTYSLTKNRLIMMTKKASLKRSSIKSGGAILTLMMSFLLFCNTVEAQDERAPSENAKENNIESVVAPPPPPLPPAPPPPPPPPPPFPEGAKYYLEGKEVSLQEANKILAEWKHYRITRKKNKKGTKEEFHITKK